jgi:branched-chain amino acid transport system ATP-binding protein
MSEEDHSRPPRASNYSAKLAVGTPTQVLADPDIIKAYLGSKDQ